ncbi:MAG: phosphoglycerate kinase [Alphaproteobacteria bacterium]|nr:phosphoglycerate kinase [Alphaproteobacteria bacterium]
MNIPLPIRSMDQAELRNKRVLVRVDLNVPMQDGQVTDTTRLMRVAPTLIRLAECGARVIVLSHFGRPKGLESRYSLRVLQRPLAQALVREVAFASDCVGRPAEGAIRNLPVGGVLLLENLRFHEGEEKNDAGFAKQLAALGDVFVSDAFSAAHRAHASTVGLAKYLPAYAGPLMEEEIDALHKSVDAPTRPLAAVIGGAKVSTKLKVIENLLEKVDVLLIGGAMANTFLLAQGLKIGSSLGEPDLVPTAERILHQAEGKNCRVLLPNDAVIADKLEPGVASRLVRIDAVPERAMILDVGPSSIANYLQQIQTVRSLVWNGPLGAFEIAPFDEGSVALARGVADYTRAGALISVAGGGDTVALLNQAGVTQDFTYVSTAGGAFLEYLEGASLPGVECLRQKPSDV